MARQVFTGTLIVHRDQYSLYGRETLVATVELANGKEFYYHRCPKAFDDLITDGQKNKIKVAFVADADGKNPRMARATGDAY